jgi:hypothetical protein
MPTPYDYTLNVQAPFQALAQGYQTGAAIRNDQQAQVQQQAALQQQQQQQQVIRSLMSNPNAGAADYANAMLVVPGLKDQLTNAWKTKNDAQQQASLSDTSQWAAAIQQGQPKVASDAIRARADAMENSAGAPTPQSQALRTQADIIDAHPEFAGFLMKSKLSAMGDAGAKVVDQLASMQKQPADLRKANADATSAEAKASVDTAAAPALAVKPAIDNAKTESDMRIAELDTQIKQADSETKRGALQLERDKLVQEQAQQKTAKAQAAQDSMDTSTQALQTLADIKNHPGFDGFWTGPGTKWGAVWGKVPGSDRQALNNWVDSLRGQLGFDALMKAKASSPTGASGFGALSEGELKLISSLAAKLDPNSSDFPAQLNTIQKYLEKSQAKAVASPNLPTSGGAFVMNTPRYGVVDEGRVNSLLKQFPGSSRAQVLQFLQAQGK